MTAVELQDVVMERPLHSHGGNFGVQWTSLSSGAHAAIDDEEDLGFVVDDDDFEDDLDEEDLEDEEDLDDDEDLDDEDLDDEDMDDEDLDDEDFDDEDDDDFDDDDDDEGGAEIFYVR